MYRDNLIELNERISAAKEAMAQRRTLTEKRATALAQKEQLAERVQNLADELAKEQADVALFEGTSVRGILVAIFSDKEKRLDKERQEAAAAALKHKEAITELSAVEGDVEGMDRALVELENAQSAYDAAMHEKSTWLANSEGPVAKEIAELYDHLATTRTDIREMTQAREAGSVAQIELDSVLGNLKKAAGWGTFDILAGSMLSSIAKHDHIDDARRHAQNAQLALNVFSRELKDVDVHAEVVIDISSFSKFADIFFDNIVSDLMVQSKIRGSLERTQQWLAQVQHIMAKLDARYGAARREQERLSERLRQLIEKW